jgi:hypothetical protein
VPAVTMRIVPFPAIVVLRRMVMTPESEWNFVAREIRWTAA